VEVIVEDKPVIALPELVEQVEVGQAHAYGVGVVLLDIFSHRPVSDVVSVARLKFQIAVLALVEIVVHRNAVVDLFLSEGISGPEPCRQLAVGTELVAGAYVELIGKSPPMVIAHVERVEHRVEAHIALVVESEMGIHVVEHVIADHVPHHILHPVSLGYVIGGGTTYGIVVLLLREHLVVHCLLVVVKRVGTHFAHLLIVVLVGDAVCERLRQVEIGHMAARHLAVDKPEAGFQFTFLRYQRLDARPAHV